MFGGGPSSVLLTGLLFPTLVVLEGGYQPVQRLVGGGGSCHRVDAAEGCRLVRCAGARHRSGLRYSHLYSTGLPAVPLYWVLIRDPQEEFEIQALFCTDLDAEPGRVISWFVRRWQMEAPFREVRRRLGFEDSAAMAREGDPKDPPALLGLFSLVTLFAHQRMGRTAPVQ